MRTLTLADCDIALEMEQERMPYVGNCSCIDPETDAASEQWIRNQLESGNEWAWCSVTVRLTYKGLSAEDYLGGCSYLSRADFVKAGDYYDDMLHEALTALNKQLAELCSCTEVT